MIGSSLDFVFIIFPLYTQSLQYLQQHIGGYQQNIKQENENVLEKAAPCCCSQQPTLHTPAIDTLSSATPPSSSRSSSQLLSSKQ